MDAEGSTSHVENSETSTTCTEIINKTGQQDCIPENSEEESAHGLFNAAESNLDESKKRCTDLKHINNSDSDDQQLHEESSKMRRKTTLIDSDSELDNDEESRRNRKPEIVQKPKRLTIFDSDSEEELKSKESDKSDGENEGTVKKHETADVNKTDIYIFNKEGKLLAENNKDYHYSRVSALCDPDTSDEDIEVSSEHKSELADVTRNVKQNKKSKSKPQREKAPKKMTGKEALEQKQEILSESRRRTRERQVSLPYHVPKHRTLQEFLQNRPRFADALPNQAAQARPSLAMKMSGEQLKAMSKNLEEREKKLEEFFKSESESEEEQERLLNDANDEDATKVSSNKNDSNTDKNKEMNSDQTMNCDEVGLIQEVTTGEVNSEENQINENGTFEKEGEKVNSEENRINENGIFEKEDEEEPAKNSEENQLNENVKETEEDSATNSEENQLKESGNIENEFREECTTNSEENQSNKNGKEDSNGPATNSLEVQFSLDSENCASGDLQLTNEAELEQKKINNVITKYSKDEDTKSNEDKDCNSEQVENKLKSKLETLKDSLALHKPKLSGNPNEIIDLDKGVTKPNEVTQLMERFMQHTAKKNHHKTNVHVDVISMVNGEIHKEILSVPVDPDEMETLAIIEKPGARLRKLQDELQTQMAQRRSELWKQKSLQHDKKNSNESDHKTESHDDAILDDEEEEEECELTETESEVSDEELVQEKPRKKLAFADEEAEESDRQESDVELHEGDEDGVEEVVNKENPDVVDGDDESEDTPATEVKRKRKLRRIVQAFRDDSDEDNEPPHKETIVAKQPGQQNKVAVDDSTDTWDDNGPPPNQPPSNRTPRREFSQTKSQLGFLTPVLHLTGLQNFNSGSKFLQESPVTPFDLNVLPSPSQSSQVLQKKLFPEAPSEEVQVKALSPIKTQNVSEEVVDSIVPSTQELLEICSGSFSPNKEGLIKTQGPPENTVTSGQVTEVFSELDSNDIVESSQCRTSTDCNTDADNDDRIISQLLDEEELEKFKKKFESPLSRPSQTVVSATPPNTAGRFAFDSSDEETSEQIKKRAKQRKLVFSDEEVEENDGDYNIISKDSDEDEDDANEEKLIEYDSEENEIEVEKENLRETFKVSDFVENEAELSESDWGSADEDEKDLDDLEFEQGDVETFDENKVRSDLERIHMRRILDDDNRQVKILQELLLEDGELHGTGRQRQFKWRNIDSVGNDTEGAKDESGMYADENVDGENEEQWRKLRYQRELFLKKMQSKSQEDDECLAYNSQVFKLGQAAIKRSISQNTADNERSSETTNIKHRLLLVKRGSFLTRTDEVLTRLAEYSKVTSVSNGATVKNSRKFVFQSVAAEQETGKKVTVGKKRKPSDETPNAMKRLRLSNLSPAASPARNEKNNRVKKLFGNW